MKALSPRYFPHSFYTKKTTLGTNQRLIMTTNTTRRDLLKSLTLGSGSLVLSPLIRQLSAQAAVKNEFPNSSSLS